MKIIRDENQNGMNTPCISIIPLLVGWGIKRCNIVNCKNNPTTIISGTEAPVFGMCENHFQEAANTKGNYNLKLEFS